jgi:hypothetical protein
LPLTNIRLLKSALCAFVIKSGAPRNLRARTRAGLAQAAPSLVMVEDDESFALIWSRRKGD